MCCLVFEGFYVGPVGSVGSLCLWWVLVSEGVSKVLLEDYFNISLFPQLNPERLFIIVGFVCNKPSVSCSQSVAC